MKLLLHLLSLNIFFNKNYQSKLLEIFEVNKDELQNTIHPFRFIASIAILLSD